MRPCNGRPSRRPSPHQHGTGEPRLLLLLLRLMLLLLLLLLLLLRRRRRRPLGTPPHRPAHRPARGVDSRAHARRVSSRAAAFGLR